MYQCNFVLKHINPKEVDLGRQIPTNYVPEVSVIHKVLTLRSFTRCKKCLDQ